jgi:hypothetical protein
MWHRIADELRKTFDSSDDASFLADRQATKFILTWMREIKKFQKDFGILCKRMKRPSIADDFTSAVAICLDRFLGSRGFPETVWSERATKRKRGAPKPDVSVWSESETLVAAVECKTDFGWSRKYWKENFEQRTKDLEEYAADCASYLCVLSEKGWEPFEFKNSPNFKKRWFCLCNEGPAWVSNPVKDTEILTPIEPMFLDILERLRVDNKATAGS